MLLPLVTALLSVIWALGIIGALVGGITSIADYIERINQAMNGGGAGAYAIPTARRPIPPRSGKLSRFCASPDRESGHWWLGEAVPSNSSGASSAALSGSR